MSRLNSLSLTIKNKQGMIRVSINGFGRIGRLAFRKMQNHPELEVVAVDDLSAPQPTLLRCKTICPEWR